MPSYVSCSQNGDFELHNGIKPILHKKEKATLNQQNGFWIFIDLKP
jgi:hypothetical protein